MAAEMVLVGCKAPNGVVLNLDRYIVTNEQNNTVRRVNGKATVTLNGWSHRIGKPDPTEGHGGFALTSVPLDFWEAWLADHEDFPMIEDKTIVGPGAPKGSRDVSGMVKTLAKVPAMHAQSTGELKAAEFKKDD